MDRYQIDEALRLSAVLSTIGLVEEVADDPVATGTATTEPELDLSIFDTPAEPVNPAEAAFNDIDQERDVSGGLSLFVSTSRTDICRNN